MENAFRRLPSVDRLLADERLAALAQSYPHDLLLDLARQALDRARRTITEGGPATSVDGLVEAIAAEARALTAPSLRPVVNASGVILHTNLGRAPLCGEAIAAMNTVATGYCNVEFDLETGTRGSRNTHLNRLLRQLTGAEASLVVNNNAAAVLLALTALAKRKEVIVSRGQAVEIGGGFRVPDVMRQSGVKLVEVGTTNCTYAADYEAAITPRTAGLLRVHSSNFKLVGFTQSVVIEELAAVAKRHELVLFDDLGSGCLIDTAQFGLDPEPMVQQSVAAGAGLTMFSGDKLLGGPQAGIIVGKKSLVEILRRHPLSRALRVDKLRIAGLAATLVHYLKGEAMTKVPVWQMIAAPVDEIERRATVWATAMGGAATVVDGRTEIGGGSLPGSTLPTKLLAIRGGSGQTVQALAKRLADRPLPIIGRISGDTLLLDPRSVLPQEDTIVIRALRELTPAGKAR